MKRRRLLVVLALTLSLAVVYAWWAARPTCFAPDRLVCDECDLVFHGRGYTCYRRSRLRDGTNHATDLAAASYEHDPARVPFSTYSRRFRRWPCYFESYLEVHHLGPLSERGDGVRVSIYHEDLQMSLLGYEE